MKDEIKLNLNGREIPARFDLGAFEDFCEETGMNIAQVQEGIANDFKLLRALIHHCVLAAGVTDVSRDELKRLRFEDVGKFMEGMNTGNMRAAKGK